MSIFSSLQIAGLLSAIIVLIVIVAIGFLLEPLQKVMPVCLWVPSLSLSLCLLCVRNQGPWFFNSGSTTEWENELTANSSPLPNQYSCAKNICFSAGSVLRMLGMQVPQLPYLLYPPACP